MFFSLYSMVRISLPNSRVEYQLMHLLQILLQYKTWFLRFRSMFAFELLLYFRALVVLMMISLSIHYQVHGGLV